MPGGGRQGRDRLAAAEPHDPFRRPRIGLAAIVVLTLGGTLGYLALGFTPLNALYQTVTTVATVGFGEVEPLTPAGQVFTMVLIVLGVGTVFWTLGVLIEALVEGELSEVFGRRRMERRIESMRDHVVVCGWGRVGREIAHLIGASGRGVVVVDVDPDRVATVPGTVVLGDATDDTVLCRAGIERASVLVAALATDAANLYVTLSGRALRPDLFILARARDESSEPKLLRAGADRVVNPQRIGAQRIAAFALQPSVAEFLDVVMHDGSLEFRLEEVVVAPGSDLVGRSLRDSHLRDRTGALVLALRAPSGEFLTNPVPETVIAAEHVLIAIGTTSQLEGLEALAR